MSIIVIMIFICLVSIDYSRLWGWLIKAHRKMMLKRSANIFGEHYLEGKSFYLYSFRQIPCKAIISSIDIEKGFTYIEETYRSKIVDMYQSSFYNRDDKKQEFSKTLLVM